MNNKITWLLGKAKKLEDVSLAEDISALESLGEKAGVRSKEYKNLLSKVNALITKEDGVIEEKVVVEASKTVAKKLSYAGIKMIGSLYYSSKDSYTKSFATADECALHFNGG